MLVHTAVSKSMNPYANAMDQGVQATIQSQNKTSDSMPSTCPCM